MAIASMTFQASLRFVDQTLSGLFSILGVTDGTVALRLVARSVDSLIGCLLRRFIVAIALPRFKQGEAYSEEANNLPRLLDEAPFPCGAGAEEDACHVAALPVDPRPHTLSSTKKRSVHRSSIARRR